MTKICNDYTFEQINLFVDNELPQDEHDAIAAHCSSCPVCKYRLEQLSAVSDVFTRHVNQQTASMDAGRFQPDAGRYDKTLFGNVLDLFGKNIYVKLVSVAAIILISFLMVDSNILTPAGPSAIVKSVDTERSSVMIFETQKQKHTIIWFSET